MRHGHGFDADALQEESKRLLDHLGQGCSTFGHESHAIIQRYKEIAKVLDALRSVELLARDATAASALLSGEADDSIISELDGCLTKASSILDDLEIQAAFRHKYDKLGCYVSFQANSGGKEAMDFTRILIRMYTAYWQSMGFVVEEIDKDERQQGLVASATYKVAGLFAYGHMKHEAGTHRLARVSPYNAAGKRQTSFCILEVIPDLPKSKFTVPESDLEIDNFARSSGPGGQNVNKTATAIRITHKPTGIQVVASTFREKLQNQKQAMSILVSRLESLHEDAHRQELALYKNTVKGRGTQIRTYIEYDDVVVDHRNGHHAFGYEMVLNGNVHEFVVAQLKATHDGGKMTKQKERATT